MEQVDVLIPPLFTKSGVVKERHQAYADGDWIGGFNLWIVQTEPIPAIVYQVRKHTTTWEPGKLDVSAAGHYTAGETLWDGLREAKEELGKSYSPKMATHLGRRLNVSPDTKGIIRHNVIDICLVVDDQPLRTYILQEDELDGICVCSISDLKKVFTDKNYSFETRIVLPNGNYKTQMITSTSFPQNWDNYHYKMALLAEKFIAGEQDLVY